MFVPFSRLMTVLMGGVVVFGLLVPMALAGHHAPLAVVLGLLFAAYVVVNVLLWRRMKPRA
ncbi:MAG TPA: hypothetical protein VMH02_00445 [Verrucomicrobiae bacterium]|nr:hypothetical protein [Verrucomicrobiae bacterium]